MIIDRYVSREVMGPFFRVITVLLVVFTGYVGALYLNEASKGTIPASIVFHLIGLKMVIGLEVLLPTAFYLGVVIGIGRMYSDSEMTVIQAAGISEARVMRPVLWLGLLVGSVVALLSLFAHPWAYKTTYELEAEALSSFDIGALEPGHFLNLRQEGQVLYAREVDHQSGEMEGSFFQSGGEERLRVIQSEDARFVQGGLHEPPRMEFGPGQLFSFDRYGTADTRITFSEMVMPLAGYAVEDVVYKRKAASSAYLMRSERDEDLAEFQWRLTTPIATLLLGLLGVSFARAGPRQGRYARLAMAILFYALFFNLGALAKTWVEEHWVDAYVPGMWWILAVPLLLLIYFLLKPHRYR